MKKLDDYINKVQTLPPAPRVLLQLMSFLGDSQVDSSRVVELVTFDPALAAKVLQRCNNAALGRVEPVDDLHLAVNRLGLDEIYRLTASVIAESTLRGSQKGYGLEIGDLWRHSAATAIAAQVIARELGGDENLIYTAALLHDIGKIVLGAALKTHGAALQGIGESNQSFVEAEKALLGVEHAEVGGRVLARWNFPDSLVRTVWYHHAPLLARPFEQLASCVYLADMVAHVLGCGPGYQSYAVRGRGEVMELLEITPGNLENFILLTSDALDHAKCFHPAKA